MQFDVTGLDMFYCNSLLMIADYECTNLYCTYSRDAKYTLWNSPNQGSFDISVAIKLGQEFAYNMAMQLRLGNAMYVMPQNHFQLSYRYKIIPPDMDILESLIKAFPKLKETMKSSSVSITSRNIQHKKDTSTTPNLLTEQELSTILANNDWEPSSPINSDPDDQ